ncbi:MAG: hypothetical protein ACI91R_002321 [Vicingaceae bacterium]|jgi:hypothetical protein
MKKISHICSFIVLLSFFVSSCSVVKNRSASNNFKRVKYNSHVKLSKSKSENIQVAKLEKKPSKTIDSFDEEVMQKEGGNVYTSAVVGKKTKKVMSQATSQAKQINAEKVTKVLENISNIQLPLLKAKKLNKLAQKIDGWWEDDIEDWPWLEIALAVIAILIIIMLVSLLLSILGGLVSSLLGLILLIALAYILFTLWI